MNLQSHSNKGLTSASALMVAKLRLGCAACVKNNGDGVGPAIKLHMIDALSGDNGLAINRVTCRADFEHDIQRITGCAVHRRACFGGYMRMVAIIRYPASIPPVCGLWLFLHRGQHSQQQCVWWCRGQP